MKKLVILALALLALSSLSMAQLSSSDIEFAATVAALGGPLTLEVGSGPVWDALKPGTAYTCVADEAMNVGAANITPFDPAQGEAFTPGQVLVTGAPGNQVLVTFVMPTKLFPSTSMGYVTMSYDNQSAGLFDADNLGMVVDFWNPTVPHTITLPLSGTATIDIGGNPATSADAQDDTYMGYGLVSVEYVGL